MTTKPRSRIIRVAKLRVGDEIRLDRNEWGLVTEISNSGNLYHVKVVKGPKDFDFPMFAERAVRIIRR